MYNTSLNANIYNTLKCYAHCCYQGYSENQDGTFKNVRK